MKQLFFSLIFILAMASCESDVQPVVPFKIKATDMISIKPAPGVVPKVRPFRSASHLSALEIVRLTAEVVTPKFSRSFAPVQRDTVSSPPRLLMWATDVISLDGDLQVDWIEASDVLFVVHPVFSMTPCDTIAFIPNSTLRAAEAAIKKAYLDKDLSACYSLFNSAYSFVPITGPEWRELKARGQN